MPGHDGGSGAEGKRRKKRSRRKKKPKLEDYIRKRDYTGAITLLEVCPFFPVPPTTQHP